MSVLSVFRRRSYGSHAGEPYDPYTAPTLERPTQPWPPAEDITEEVSMPPWDLLAAEHDRWYGWDNSPGILQRTAAALRVTPRPPDMLLADLDKPAGGHGGCPIFRDLVHSYFVRAEPHHGCPDAPRGDGTWQERFAAVYRHRTGDSRPAWLRRYMR